MARIVGRTNVFTLSIALSTGGGDIPTDADLTPTAVITTDAGAEVIAFSALDVAHPALGTYRVSWTPQIAGSYVIIWTFVVDGSSFENRESFTVVRVTSDNTATEQQEPSVGYGNTCKVTGTFLSARGDFQVGVHVRFTPAFGTTSITNLGIISRESTVQTDTQGRLEMYLLKGQRGTIAISNLGLVREVEIPDETEVDIFDLMALADDPLAVQVADTYPLIRRSLP
jgi:hypothetical protein